MISVEDVTVAYGEVVALDQVTFKLQPGRVCALVGMNGSGKSTLFRTIIGLQKPQTGRVLVQGQPPAVARKTAQVAYVPQTEQVDWDFPLSVRDVVLTGRRGRPRAADYRLADDALRRVDLLDLADRQIGQLSGGQKKRAFVARGIAQQAPVLLLDEPFAGVDRPSESLITGLLRELASEGATVLVSTHDLQRIPLLADEVILLMRTVLKQGTPAQVLKPENLVAAFGSEVGE